VANDWYVQQPLSGSLTTGGGGSLVAGYRSLIDAQRSAAAPRVPGAEYPDGYLGHITNRREGRLQKELGSRLTDRSYQRGVHKGDKIDPQDYQWDKSVVDPMAGLRAEAKGKRWNPALNPVEHLAHGGKVDALTPAQISALSQKYGLSAINAVSVNPARQKQLSTHLPSWK
jgi:hypothetical protein